MPRAAQETKKIGSTQKFIEIKDIRESIVLLEGNNACLIIEAQAINFALLSPEEKQAKIATYASMLNSLTFPIQIIIQNKRVDISSYLSLLDKETRTTANQKLLRFIQQYREFVRIMIRVNTVLDKKFYIVIPYSNLEQGALTAIKKDDIFTQAKASLQTKAETLLSQLARLALRAKILDQQTLVKLFYDIYNQPLDRVSNIEEAVSSPAVQGIKKQ